MNKQDKILFSVVVVLLIGIVFLNFYGKNVLENPISKAVQPVQKQALGNLLTGAAVGVELSGQNLESQQGLAIQSAASCWDSTHSASQAACEADFGCKWHQDPWGSWCEQKGCWNFYDSASCGQSNAAATSNYINKSCAWTSSSSSWCSMIDCWSFNGNYNSCITSNTTYGIQCSWDNVTDQWSTPCTGPGEKQCWKNQNSTSCENSAGCKWGMCNRQSCWDYTSTSQSTCESKTGYNGKACDWKVYSWGTECVEQSCWNYGNKTACETDNCTWSGSYCSEISCGYYGSQNASYCLNNTINLSCTWEPTWKTCSQKGCWNNPSANSCNSAGGCIWETYNSGWCEGLGCWSPQFNTQTNCTNATLHPGLTCGWGGNNCFENVTAKTCNTINIEKNCMDTFYCWWNQSASTCNDPSGTYITDFVAWNPGCYIFDRESSICSNTTYCYWNASNSKCGSNSSFLNNNQLNCTLIQNKTTCGTIPAFSSCCTWDGSTGQCVTDKFDNSCHNNMEEPPEGAYYCEDYNAYTSNDTCLKIASSPWFMPCSWNNATERCEFKGDMVFGSNEKNIMMIDNEVNCIAAGGDWLVDTYPSTNDPTTAVKLALGRCDYKFDGERNCDKECYACEFKTDSSNWTSAKEAKDACFGSKTGMCEFKQFASQESKGKWGDCQPREEFKKGLVKGDCKTDCGACSYTGNPSSAEKFTGTKPSYDSCIAPSCYCDNSPAKCKWISDPQHADDESYGRCALKSEKTCDDKCDKCYDETICKNKGAKKGNTSSLLSAQCVWEDGICNFKSGADQMELCWDGLDNNGDQKIDCADSMCWSDSFCGGGMLFDDFGKDCFTFSTQTGCEAEGCSWVNENWGSWCDMPGAVCWKKDGTNESWCESGFSGGGGNLSNASCEWHGGFGGFCEQDWVMGGSASSCTGYNHTFCDNQTGINMNCTWMADTWCQGGGGYCDPNILYGGSTWYNCPQYDDDGQSICQSSGTADSQGDYPCQWFQDSWCLGQGANAGYCDHKSFSCYQFNQTVCTDTFNTTFNHSQWCGWKTDSYSSTGGWCESKMTSGGTGSCWEQTTSNGCQGVSGCSWSSGFCDPKGFGGEFTAGMTGGGGASGVAMGGSGMQCFKYNGNQTYCENQTGCGWMTEQWPFCDVNFESNCPQYTFSQNDCTAQNRCKWNSESNFCDEKPFECFWNNSLRTDSVLCDASPICYWSSTMNSCQPMHMNATSQATCGSYNSTLFKWVSGWCNPEMASEFFKGMEMSGPPTPLGTDADDTTVPKQVDILSFGMKDTGNAFGFGITVEDIKYAAACNNIKLSSGIGTGKNITKFYWYLDTDGVTTGGCALNHNSGSTGYEFYIRNEWSYDNNTGSVTDSPAVYRCSDGSWIKAEIKVSSDKQIMCTKIGGAMIAVDKADLEKFSALYDSGKDIRVVVASANSTRNITSPSDSADPGWVTPGSQDFELLDLYGYETDWTKKAKKDGLDAGYIQYGEDANCWTKGGCGNYSCEGHPYCVANLYGVESATWTDSKIPSVTGVIKEVYPNSSLVMFYTDKPANGTLKFFKNDGTCAETSLNATIKDIGLIETKIDNYTLAHMVELYNDGGVSSLNYDLQSSTPYFYKIKVCDNTGKCGESKCSNFTTEKSSNCPFCKFVSKIDAPSGWNVYYDLNQDGSYEHWQGHILGANDGMYTNFSEGRRANIMFNSSDGKEHIEFLNATLTKTGMSPDMRDLDEDNAQPLKNGTDTTAAGTIIGYVGMVEDVRDRIVNGLYPKSCRIKIPKGGTTCDALWHCNNVGSNCVNRITEGTLVNITADSCTWEIPCEFSLWAGGQPGTSGGSSSSSSSSGGGSARGGGGILPVKEAEVSETTSEETKEVGEQAEGKEEASATAGAGVAAVSAGEDKKALTGMAIGQAVKAVISSVWFLAAVVIVVLAIIGVTYLRKAKAKQNSSTGKKKEEI